MPHLATEIVNDTTVRLVYKLAAPVSKVYGLWADRDAFHAWFCPSEPWDCSVPEYDFRPGGSYRVRMVAPDKDLYEVFGAFEKIEPESLISFSWNWVDSPSHPGTSHVQISFEPSEDSTRMTLTHSNFTSIDSRNRHNEGWDNCVARLEKALAD